LKKKGKREFAERSSVQGGGGEKGLKKGRKKGDRCSEQNGWEKIGKIQRQKTGKKSQMNSKKETGKEKQEN